VVTIKEVAKLAGVAVSTASNALNGKYGVKLETKNRVMEVAKQLNYVPNPIAQGLVKNSTGNISILVSGPSSFKIFTNPVFFEVIQAITETLNEGNYRTILSVSSAEKEAETINRVVHSRSSDALILVGTRKNDRELTELLADVNIPALVVIRSTPHSDFFAVSVDNEKCGYLATKHLIDMGHRTIGYLGSLPGVSLAEQRLEGYRKALFEAGIPYEEGLVVEGDYYQESGFSGMRILLKQSSRRPTALITGNDLMALGAMEALEQEGLRVPEDISIVGCDNIPNLHLLKVPLTTVSIPFHELGRLSAKKMVGILEGKDDMPSQIILDPELRIRKSVFRLTD
jgi:LacI family transcriptional regulator